LAAESPYKPVAEIVGSGPYRFLKDEHVSGARAIFERFAEYQPRAGGPVGFTAGPKVAHFERVEWVTLDPFSASAALRRGEIDWWENPPRDLIDQVSGDPNITVVSHFATAIGIMPSINSIHRSTTRRSGAPCSALSINPRRCRRSPAATATIGETILA